MSICLPSANSIYGLTAIRYARLRYARLARYVPFHGTLWGATGTFLYARARVFFHSKSVHAPRFYSVVTMAGCHRHLSIHRSEYCFYMQNTAHAQAFSLFSQKSGPVPDFCTIAFLR